jgi:hypothetical protein
VTTPYPSCCGIYCPPPARNVMVSHLVYSKTEEKKKKEQARHFSELSLGRAGLGVYSWFLEKGFEFSFPQVSQVYHNDIDN